ncbi:MAG TPA: GlsB/YeaQ/YmgE family stress response membrane protein [Candidatus Baltobacteraceae bacterium]|jgi:uncharacterized membrane protein YeaQ/YmgE (transglycosylase-associated protein family)|nr:GlsB/YeaQ/YmgE family stress response membrane protein [Candidatus Baltobacteraceae bacterium]
MLAECLAGFAVGLVARYFVPDSPGAGVDTLLGIVGGGVAAFVYKLFGHRLSVDDFNVWSVIVAAVGALVLIILSRAAGGRRTIAP